MCSAKSLHIYQNFPKYQQWVSPTTVGGCGWISDPDYGFQSLGGKCVIVKHSPPFTIFLCSHIYVICSPSLQVASKNNHYITAQEDITSAVTPDLPVHMSSLYTPIGHFLTDVIYLTKHFRKTKTRIWWRCASGWWQIFKMETAPWYWGTKMATYNLTAWK